MQPVLLPFGTGPVIGGKRFRPDPVIDTGRPGPLFIEADAGQFRAGVGAPGHPGIVGPARQAEDGVGQDHTPLVAGGMGELVAADDIAGGIDMSLASAQSAVDLDAAVAADDADSLQTKAGGIGCTPVGHEDLGGGDGSLHALGCR